MYFIHNSELYDYADDNTLSYADTDINKLIEIEYETEGKLLGVAIYFKLNFNDHISNIC